MSPHRAIALDGFEQVRKRPHRFRCTICAGTFVMNYEGMVRHAKEAEHTSKIKEKHGVGWGNWDAAEANWEQAVLDWGEPRDPDELARWMPSAEELGREKAEREKREWILKWVKDVEASNRL